MNIQFKKTKNPYKTSLTVTIILTVIFVFCYSVFLVNYSIRQNIITIGIFSEQFDSKDIHLSINQILSDSSTDAYQAGVTALEQAGYRSSVFPLFMQRFFSGSYLFAGFFALLIFFIFVYLWICIRQRRAYFMEVQKIIDWTNDTSLVLPEQYPTRYLPPALLMSIYTLRKQLNRQKILHEEDTARIMKYMENISHQLKTPLAVIHATCERLAMRHPDIEEKMSVCLTQTGKMTSLIRDFLQLGRFDCNKQDMQFAYVHAVDLIETVTNDLNIIALKKHLTFVEQGQIDVLWYCDIFWMEEILGNILKNCMEHSENGEIHISYGQQEDRNYLLIRDCGTGLKDGFEKKIFERYSSADRTHLEGSGLGLSIAQQVMKLHFGTITASNRQEGGVEFRLSFPQLDSQTIYH